jgi:hypothetical protein
MMTAIEKQVTFQPQRMPFDFFVMFGVIDPGPGAGAKVRDDLCADGVAKIGILTPR